MSDLADFKLTAIAGLVLTCLVNKCYCPNSGRITDQVTECSLGIRDQKISLSISHRNGPDTCCELLPSLTEAKCITTRFYTSKTGELRDLLLMLGVLSSHTEGNEMVLGCIELLKNRVESISKCRLRDGLLYHPCQLPNREIQRLRIEPDTQLHYEELKHNKIIPEEVLGVVTLLYRVELLFLLPRGDRPALFDRYTIGGKWVPLGKAPTLWAACTLKAFFEENPHEQLPSCQKLIKFLRVQIERYIDDTELYMDRKKPFWSSKMVTLSQMLDIFSKLELVLFSYIPHVNELVILTRPLGDKYTYPLIWSFDSTERECMESAIKAKKQKSKIQNMIVTKYFMELLLTKKQLPYLDEFAQRVISSCELRLENNRTEDPIIPLSVKSSNIQRIVEQDNKWQTKRLDILSELLDNYYGQRSIRRLVKDAFRNMLDLRDYSNQDISNILDLRTYSDKDISMVAKFTFAVLTKNQELIHEYVLKFRRMHRDRPPAFNICLAGVQGIQEIWDKYSCVRRSDALEAIVSLFRLDEIEEINGINTPIIEEVNRLFREYELVKSGIYQ